VNRAGAPDGGGWFARRYGGEPDGSWFAPGRVNLMGGPDYTETFVLPVTLRAGVYAAAARRGDGRVALVSRQAGEEPVVLEIDSLEPGSVQGWAAYPAGVAWALREAGYLAGGADLAIDADLPAGSGLSSSAALECSVALALCSLSGVSVPREQLALIAKRAENEFVGAPTGIIDQSATLLCQPGHAMLLDCGTLGRTQVPFRPSAAGAVTLIVDTSVTHRLVSGEYAARRAECEEAARLLGVPALGLLADADAVAALADPVLRRRARHVITDSARARAIASALQRGGADRTDKYRADTYRYVGTLLTEGHVSLRDEFEVSWPQADAAVDVAIGSGAYGAKMIGGGFGGSVLALIPAEREATVRSLLSETFQERGWAAPEYLDAVPSPAARRRGDRVKSGFS
jgi:galactokinase